VQNKVLIVEDETSASRLVASLCAEVGLAAVETPTGEEAKAALEGAAVAGEPFAAVVLDLVLGELDGFKVGQFMRGQPWGANTPLVVMSGVYKQANPDLMRELHPVAYFAKPFEPAQMRDALVKACNVPGVATAVEGNLSEKPAAAVFVDLLRQKVSGILTVTGDSAVRKIHFQQGQIRFAHSNVLAESAGSAQVASGVIRSTRRSRIRG